MIRKPIELKEGICPRCGKETTYEKYEWDDGLCGGYGFQWDEVCKPCDIRDCERMRKRVKEERREAKYQEKLKFYKKYYED